jgi:uncharacterized protein (DUF3820 family)
MLDPDEFREILEEIGRTRMPFGKYGPDHYPPYGVPIYDLPAEYLQWFKREGFPKNRLGELLEIIYHAKADGADAIFAQIRSKNGGRTRLAKPRRKSYEFED